MKPSPKSATKSRPVAPPDWETADLKRLVDIAKEAHPLWWVELAKKLPLSRKELKDEDSALLADLVVLLTGQVRYWRDEAHRLYTPENRERARIEMARLIAKDFHEYQCAPRSTNLEHELVKLSVDPDHAGHRDLILYNWQATVHDAAALRRALGYREAQFRNLAKETCARLEEPYQLPLKVERKGRSTLYPRVVALLLLAHRLAHLARAKRIPIAKGIWKWRANGSKGDDEGLRAVLQTTGVEGLRRRAAKPKPR